MFRPTLLLNAASKATLYRTTTPTLNRFYSAGVLFQADIEFRVLDILKDFDKIDQSKVALDADFVTDLGLDSLDTVEIVMVTEEGFSVEIPDKEAHDIKTPRQAVEYISQRSDAR